jgi:hypothetical protein
LNRAPNAWLHLRVIRSIRFRAAPRRSIIDRAADNATSMSRLRDNVAAKPGESQKPIMTTAPMAASCVTNPICRAYGLIENIPADQKSVAARAEIRLAVVSQRTVCQPVAYSGAFDVRLTPLRQVKPAPLTLWSERATRARSALGIRRVPPRLQFRM